MVIKRFLVFALMLNPLTLNKNKKVTNWISTGVSTEKNKPFDTKLQPTMSSQRYRKLKT